MEEAARAPPVVVASGRGVQNGLAVSLAFEDEEAPRVRWRPRRLPCEGSRLRPMTSCSAELDALLTAELHARAPGMRMWCCRTCCGWRSNAVYLKAGAPGSREALEGCKAEPVRGLLPGEAA